ncbi:penicillin-binding transpeptidase domain-containing protein [Marinimicrobium sp. ABcell2]|uniref:penicillin-binding transpeptidase domain-containing protein n=1 Tax=Marinimicrobium sp. ABcell2 TaxID=3069751 RepID=UPI0027B29EEE|nr:penicillin-binding transpeptidase domain-containing protein [Marinimicrobium sp. ABcell2]MDQ2075901.1 penicillin-binding transpeptidase domain-containing protein [Marinimicrobium sp. ABcell2]
MTLLTLRGSLSASILRRLAPLLLASTSIACAPSTESPSPEGANLQEREVDLSEYFSGTDANDSTFVVYHPASGQLIRHNPERAQQRFPAASTYKIPNALIAIETGVAKGPDHLIPWDGNIPADAGFWSSTWSKDHTLRSAMRTSAYWYYQEIAREIGAERMLAYLDQFDYGNQSIDGGIDAFWLHGGLRISPDEQVRFLERMYSGRLGLSERSFQLVRDIIVLEENPDYRLSGKTGTADVTPNGELLWLVGYVEREEDVWFYALNMEGEHVWNKWGKPSARLVLVRAMLRELNVLPREL